MAKPKRKAASIATITTKTEGALKQESTVVTSDELIQEELDRKTAIPIPLSELYSAPASWNEWSKLPEEKLDQLCDSLLSIGIQNPCIVWKIDRERVRSLYAPNELDSYGFTGTSYMILSGHNRALATKIISETDEFVDDEEYQSIPCFVYEDTMSDDFTEKAKQIIDDTNYLSRDKTTKEIMTAIMKKTKQYQNGMIRQKEDTSKQIGKALNLTDRTVKKYVRILRNLLPELQEYLFENKISFNTAQTLCTYPKEIQIYLYEEQNNIFSNKREMANFLKNTTPDMTIAEIQEELTPQEKRVSFEKITVSVPIEHIEEFNQMFSQWKQNVLSGNNKSDSGQNVSEI